ncbi:MAG: lipid-A-disaccharide synthase [Planctomycetota bacterium]|jgi:lipid-A-disaccharide synthase|nr:lipid-A-disaccharide synthase [Planctomycetota bacterium]
MPKILLSTAEVSAETHAADLLAALKALRPDLEADAGGGRLLAAAGARLVADMSGKAVMGLKDAFASLSFYRESGKKLVAAVKRERYDAVVVVDAPSFHLPLAKIIHRDRPDLPIIYYIAPKLWVWKRWRAESLRRDFAKTLCIFPFEERYFGGLGVNAVYVGNPTRDQLRNVDGKAVAARFGVSWERRHEEPEKGLLAVFPGSRKGELSRLWPEMARALAGVRRRFPGLKPVVSLARNIAAADLAAIHPLPEGVDFSSGDSRELLAAASLVVAKSGTTTLEAALLGKPMLVCYRVDAPSFILAMFVIRIARVALPNILAGDEVVREFLQDQATAANFLGEIERLLADRRYYRTMRSRLLSLADGLGEENSALRAAREIAAFLPPRPPG